MHASRYQRAHDDLRINDRRLTYVRTLYMQFASECSFYLLYSRSGHFLDGIPDSITHGSDNLASIFVRTERERIER